MRTLSSDVVAFAEDAVACPDRWVLYNVFAHTALGVGPEVFEALSALVDGSQADGRLKEARYRVWEIATFAPAEGLLRDPSRFKRPARAWGEPERVGFDELGARLAKQCVLVDEASYQERFAPKRSIADTTHFGNLHAQLGQALLVSKRVDPAAWWLQQKFDDGARAIRKDSLYAVQDAFMDAYLPKRITKGARVLDLGCGPGVLTNKFARAGAIVVGLDPNAKYIDLARAGAAPGATFRTADVGQPGALDDVEAESFDVVFMSDALLFYFVPYGDGAPADLATLVRDVRRVLAPSGSFVCLEPHGVFYQTPWLGARERPFTVVSEYATEPRQRIVPTIAQLVSAFTSRGFVVTAMDEVRGDPNADERGERGARFAHQFPLWHLFEMRKVEAP